MSAAHAGQGVGRDAAREDQYAGRDSEPGAVRNEAVWYRMLIETVYKAEDKRAGMTAAEIATVVARAVPGCHPYVVISIRGRVQSIKIEEEQRGEGVL
jgi:hypothetical protein